jgi:hypothetical protein
MESKKVYYFYYHKKEDVNYCLEEGTKKEFKLTSIEKSKVKGHWFEVNSNYNCDIKSLFEYEKDFNKYAKDVLTYSNGKSDYKSKYNDCLAVTLYFRSKATIALNAVKITNVNMEEVIKSAKCYNGGITHVNLELTRNAHYECKPIKCYGYDFINCYAKFLADSSVSKVMIPIKEGTHKQLLDFDIMKAHKLEYGYYNFNITSENKIICKYFKFAHKNDDMYTHLSLIQLKNIIKYLIKKNSKQLDEGYIRSLVTITGSSCYVYDKKDLVPCDQIFGTWYNDLSKMKKDLKGNFLVKNYGTKLWGYLCQYNRIFVDEKDIENYDYASYSRFTDEKTYEYLCIKTSKPNDPTSKYELVKADKPYKHDGLARLKSFLISAVRLYMTKIILDNDLDDNVVRLCTDGIVLNKKFDFDNGKYEYVPLPEDKTTGFIKWYSVNDYRHVCKKCGDEWKFNKKYVHECEN